MFSVDTGWSYYLLFVDGKLASVISSKHSGELERTRAATNESSSLPHETGFAELLNPFVRYADDISTIDFTDRKPNYERWHHRGHPGEYLAWAPIGMIGIIFVPVTVPIMVHKDMKYAGLYRIEIGDPQDNVVHKLGEPRFTLGRRGEYEVLVFDFDPQAAEHTLSLGFRNDRLAWIRHHYDATSDVWRPRDTE